MSNALKIILIILLSIIAVALIGILTILLIRGDKFDFSMFNVSESKTLIEEKTVETYKEINVDANYSNVEIDTNDENVISIKLYSDNIDEYSIKDEDVINVVFKEKKRVFNLFGKSPRAVISIPKDYDKTVTVKGSVLDVKGSGSDKLNLVADVQTGDVKVEHMDKANIKLKTGDIKIESVNELIVKSNVGDVKVKSVNYKLDITGDVGDIKIEKVDLKENSFITNSTGDVKIGKTNAIYIEGKTDVGDVKINTNHRKSDVELIIKNHIGDIKVG